MAITFEQIVETGGNHLTDQELRQLRDVVEQQTKNRSPLNSPEILIAKAKTPKPDKSRRSWYYRVPRSETQQERFTRLCNARYMKILHQFKLLKNLGSSYAYLLDIELAKEVIEKIEDRVKELRTTYEKEVGELERRVSKDSRYIRFWDGKEKKHFYVDNSRCKLHTKKVGNKIRYRVSVELDDYNLSRNISADIATKYSWEEEPQPKLVVDAS